MKTAYLQLFARNGRIMIDIKLIKNGHLNGKKVWVCDLRYTDYSNKPIRHIQPTEVLVRSNEETTKRVYYSESHFVALNKKGSPIKSKVIPLFDSTGFRSRTGTPLNVFWTKEDCVKHYKTQVKDAVDGLRHYLTVFTESVNLKIDDLNSRVK